MSADSLSVADGVDQRGERPQDHLRRACRIGRPQARGDREGRGRSRPAMHRIVGQSIARFDIPGKVTGKAAYVQDMRLPGMVHGRVVRPPRYGATLDSRRRGQGEGDAGRDRGGARRLVPRRRSPSARSRRSRRARRWPKPRKWKPGPELPDPARLFEHLKSLPTKVEVIGVKQAPVLASAPKVHRGDLHQALHGARLDRPVRRGRRVQGRQDIRSGPTRRACSRCAPSSPRR